MTIRTIALLTLLLVPSTAHALPKCPLVFAGWNYQTAPCRLGQFTFRDFFFDNDNGQWDHGWIDRIEVKLFRDHLDISMLSYEPSLDYSLDPALYALYLPGWAQPFDWLRQIYSANITTDNGTTFTHSVVSSPMTVSFGVPVGGFASLDVWGGGDGIGYRCDGLTSVTSCVFGRGGGNGNPYGPYWNFNTGFFAFTQIDVTNPTPLTVSIMSPSWTTSLYFETASVVPEPSTWVLMATGLGLLGLWGWRRRHAA